MALNAQMVFAASRAAIFVLLLGLLFMYNLNNMALASSGGVMGGSFFHSDSSSDDQSFIIDAEPVLKLHDTPSSPEAELGRGSHGGWPILFLIFIFGLLLVGFYTNGNTTVLKLQVAMLGGMGNSIQRDLTGIAEAADTSSRDGVKCLLTETILALRRHPAGYCISGYSSILVMEGKYSSGHRNIPLECEEIVASCNVNLKRSRQDGEKCYNHLSKEERAKFDEETLVNLNKVQKTSARSHCANVYGNEYTGLDVKESIAEGEKFEGEKLLNEFGNEFIVNGVLHVGDFALDVSIQYGVHKLPTINGAEELKEALQKLKSLPSSKLLAGEVLWTPQNDAETLSERELLEDYPLLAKGLKSFLVKKKE